MTQDPTDNIILCTDGYKPSHFLQYRPGITGSYSYIEARGGKFTHTLFFGLQAYLDKYLSRPITQEDIDQAEEFFSGYGAVAPIPFNRAGWEHILKECGGYMPVCISAVDEGTLVKTGNVLLDIQTYDAKCCWLPSYLETSLLRAIWYPTTVATYSYACRKVLERAQQRTSDDISPDTVLYKLHDFGARGVSSSESAQLGGMAHLVNFCGTDTIEAVLAAKKYYDIPMAGFTIPAAEHSTITSWGRARESDAYHNMLKQFSDSGIIAVVSDSYDIYNAVDKIWGEQLHEDVMAYNGTIVIRPDSGDPVDVTLKCVSLLGERFGYTTNSKGYRVLDKHVRVIQGDGINISSMEQILRNLENYGWSAFDVISFGMGGHLLQEHARDDLSFSMKCSAVFEQDGSVTPVSKDPVEGRKKSKSGKLSLIWDEDICEHRTIPQSLGVEDLLQTKWCHSPHGYYPRTTFTKIRQRAASYTISI